MNSSVSFINDSRRQWRRKQQQKQKQQEQECQQTTTTTRKKHSESNVTPLVITTNDSSCSFFWYRPLGSESNVQRLFVRHKKQIQSSTTQQRKHDTVLSTWAIPIPNLDVLLKTINDYVNDTTRSSSTTNNKKDHQHSSHFVLEVVGSVNQLSFHDEWIPICQALTGRNYQQQQQQKQNSFGSYRTTMKTSFLKQQQRLFVTSVRWLVPLEPHYNMFPDELLLFNHSSTETMTESSCSYKDHFCYLLDCVQNTIQHLEIIGGYKDMDRKINDLNNNSTRKNPSASWNQMNDMKGSEKSSSFHTKSDCNNSHHELLFHQPCYYTFVLRILVTKCIMKHHHHFRSLTIANVPPPFTLDEMNYLRQYIVPHLYQLTIQYDDTLYPFTLVQPSLSSPTTTTHQSQQTQRTTIHDELLHLLQDIADNNTTMVKFNVQCESTNTDKKVDTRSPSSSKCTKELMLLKNSNNNNNNYNTELIHEYVSWNIKLNLYRQLILTSYKRFQRISRGGSNNVVVKRKPTTTTTTMILSDLDHHQQEDHNHNKLNSFTVKYDPSENSNSSRSSGGDDFVTIVDAACTIVKDWYRLSHHPISISNNHHVPLL